MTRIFTKPSGPQQIKTALERFTADVKADVKEVAADLRPKDGWSVAARAELIKDAKNGVMTFAAEAVGVFEVVGVRYPVSSYEFKVSPTLTRGSRIEHDKGYAQLAEQGYRGIVDLTLEGTKDAALAPKAGLHTLNVPILDNDAPTIDQMKAFLDFATAPENQPCYVHCEAGKGRTGVAVACYRMAVEGWSVDAALADAKKHGLGVPDQIDFIHQFADQLKAGTIAGYPKV